MRLFKAILLIQTIYYVVTALWALIHIRSFMEVTGPKTDLWLVKTVAVLLLAISSAFIAALFSSVNSASILTLAICCCLGLIFIDCYYVSKGVISKVYLLDAVAEFLLVACWIAVWTRRKRLVSTEQVHE